MKEYWINVYEDFKIPFHKSLKYESYKQAIEITKLFNNYYKIKTLYRIHVKIKPKVPKYERIPTQTFMDRYRAF